MSAKCFGIKPEEMEPNKWHDLISFGYRLHDIQFDPNVSGRIFAIGFIPSDEYDREFCGLPVMSTNNGETWVGIHKGIPVWKSNLDPSNVSLSVVWLSSTERILYCMITSEEDADAVDIFRSPDLGASWSKTGHIDNSWAFACRANPLSDYILAKETVINKNNKSLDRKESCQLIQKSVDGGKTWQEKAVFWEAGSINRFYFNPIEPGCAYATSDIYGGYFILKSTDSGESWRSILTGNGWGGMGVYNLAFHPSDPMTIVAIHNPRESMNYGMKTTTDGGLSWKDSGPENCKVWGFHYLNRMPEVQFVISGECASNIYKSSNSGGNWSVTRRNSKELEIRRYLDIFEVTSQSESTLFCNLSGMIKSTNTGDNWSAMYPVRDRYSRRLMWINPQTEMEMLLIQRYVGSFRSINGGANWISALSDPASGTYEKLLPNEFTPNVIYSVFNAYDCESEFRVLRKSENAGNTWTDINLHTNLEPLDIIASNIYANRVFTILRDRNTLDISFCVSENGGLEWRAVPIEGVRKVYSIVDDPQDDARWYSLCETDVDHQPKICLTTNSGQTWVMKGSESGFSPVNYEANLGSAIKISRPNSNILFTNMDGIFISSDRGETWNHESELVGCAGVMYIDPFSVGTIYANWADSVFTICRTTDFGKCWSNSEFPIGMYISQLNPGQIYDTNRCRLMRIASTPPTVEMVGFGPSLVNSNNESALFVIAYVNDADENDSVIGVDLYGEGPLSLYRITQELLPHSGLFFSGWTTSSPAGGHYVIQVRAVDRFALQSEEAFTVTSH